MKSTFYDKQLDRLDGLRALLATWQKSQPNDVYILKLVKRIHALSARLSGKRAHGGDRRSKAKQREET